MYPFGMQMPSRNYSTDKYRYGFNGQEKSQEISPNTSTAEYWQYDSRIVRRWNVDPVVKDDESPYLVFGGNPVVMVDPFGADWYKNNSTGNVEYRSKWHRDHKGYEYLGKGDGDILKYDGKEYNKKTGAVSILLEEAVIHTKAGKPKPQPRNTVNWLHWPSYTKADMQRSTSFHALLRDRHQYKQPLLQDDDPQDFKDKFNYYQRSWQAEQDWRKMNYAVVDFATFFVPVPKVGMFRWLRYGGRTFQEAKVAIWARNAKPVFQPIYNVANGKVFKVYAEIHHRFIPQRWNMPNWITNSRFNLQITNSIEHGLMDPFRYQFFPKWVKDGIDLGTITAESVIRVK